MTHLPPETYEDERLPEHIRGGLKDYIEHHVPVGHFLTAVLSNDLTEACARADQTNRYRLFDIVDWLYNEAPSVCWGSRRKVDAWLKAEKYG